MPNVVLWNLCLDVNLGSMKEPVADDAHPMQEKKSINAEIEGDISAEIDTFGVGIFHTLIAKENLKSICQAEEWDIIHKCYETGGLKKVEFKSPNTKVFWSAYLYRRIILCDEWFNTVDPSRFWPEGTDSIFLLHLVPAAGWPAEVSETVIGGPSVEYKYAGNMAGINFIIIDKYDFTKEVQTGTVDLSKFVYLMKKAYNNDCGYDTLTGQASYSLTRKKLELQYIPLVEDVLQLLSMPLDPDIPEERNDFIKYIKDKVSKGSNFKIIDDYYALDESEITIEGNVIRASSYFIHGNNRIKVMVDGQDVSILFPTLRYLREWNVPINNLGKPKGEYLKVEPAWGDDCLAGGPDGDVVRSSWVDVPGTILIRPPSKWAKERFFMEFVVGVRGFPEFGFLYYTVIIDTWPNAFRIRMYNAEKISVDQWCNTIKKSSQPYRGEAWQVPVQDHYWKPT